MLVASGFGAGLVRHTFASAEVRAPVSTWPFWRAFVARNISADGRVIDFSTKDQRSTSEGQAYGLFFALADNDATLFQRLLEWTVSNLAMGYLDQRLPAWHWGRNSNGQWKILDDNSASDADLWIAYALLEAGRLWQRKDYLKLGQNLLGLIKQHEVAMLPGFGPMLMPGNIGFQHDHRWRLNPSYLPIQVLRRVALADSEGPWQTLATQTSALIRQCAPAGYAPDWTVWNGHGFVADASSGTLGSYDAIRVYLWAGMLDSHDPLRAPLLKALHGPADMLQARDAFSERIDVRTGDGSGQAPIGFSAALLPYLGALRQTALAQHECQKVNTATHAEHSHLPYYDRMLILFGCGHMDRRFSFDAQGRLRAAWGKA